LVRKRNGGVSRPYKEFLWGNKLGNQRPNKLGKNSRKPTFRMRK